MKLKTLQSGQSPVFEVKTIDSAGSFLLIREAAAVGVEQCHVCLQTYLTEALLITLHLHSTRDLFVVVVYETKLI